MRAVFPNHRFYNLDNPELRHLGAVVDAKAFNSVEPPAGVHQRSQKQMRMWRRIHPVTRRRALSSIFGPSLRPSFQGPLHYHGLSIHSLSILLFIVLFCDSNANSSFGLARAFGNALSGQETVDLSGTFGDSLLVSVNANFDF